MTDNYRPKMLLVEDDMIIAADISIQLTKLGYEVVGIHTRAEDALKTIAGNRPDLILMDIVLSGKMNGIEAAQLVLEQHQVPVIFLTSNTDDATFQRALAAKPYAFIAKPFQKSDLERTLKLTLQRISVEKSAPPEVATSDHFSTMDDRLFIRHDGQLVKVPLQDVLFLEADRSYCKLYTAGQVFLIAVPLQNVEAQLADVDFLRVHRSFVVHLDKIDAVSEDQETLTIKNYQIPVSRRRREEVRKRLKMF